MKTHIVSAFCLVAASLSAATAAETVTYRYDSHGRLAGTSVAGGPAAGITTAIGYDDAGNRTSYAVSAAAAPTVVNASFEAPDVGAGFQYNPGVTGNYFASLSGVAGNTSAWGFTTPPAGNQVAFIQGSGTDNGLIVMNVDGLVTGGTYVVRISIARRTTYAPNVVQVAFQGANLGAITPGSTVFQQVTTLSFQATGAVGALSLAGTTGGDSATGIDSVSIVRLS